MPRADLPAARRRGAHHAPLGPAYFRRSGEAGTRQHAHANRSTTGHLCRHRPGRRRQDHDAARAAGAAWSAGCARWSSTSTRRPTRPRRSTRGHGVLHQRRAGRRAAGRGGRRDRCLRMGPGDRRAAQRALEHRAVPEGAHVDAAAAPRARGRDRRSAWAPSTARRASGEDSTNALAAVRLALVVTEPSFFALPEQPPPSTPSRSCAAPPTSSCAWCGVRLNRSRPQTSEHAFRLAEEPTPRTPISSCPSSSPSALR